MQHQHFSFLIIPIFQDFFKIVKNRLGSQRSKLLWALQFRTSIYTHICCRNKKKTIHIKFKCASTFAIIILSEFVNWKTIIVQPINLKFKFQNSHILKINTKKWLIQPPNWNSPTSISIFLILLLWMVYVDLFHCIYFYFTQFKMSHLLIFMET